MRLSRALGITGAILAVTVVTAAGTAGAAADGTDPNHDAGPVVVRDIQVPVPGQAPVTAYLVTPQRVQRPDSLAGILYLHWLEPSDPTQNRTEFLAEAVAMAQRGAVAILPDLAFPWTGTVHGDQRDVTAVTDQLAAVTAAWHALLAQPGVNPHRTAVVGHDYGAMYGAMLAQRDPRVAAEVFMAGDATWSNWFAMYFTTVADPIAYQALFAGLDPVDNVSRLGAALYLQWAGRDTYIPATVRDRFAAAAPAAAVSLYPTATHMLTQGAKLDRIAWLTAQLRLS